MCNDVLHLCSMASALQNLCLEIIAHSVTVAPSVMFRHQCDNKCIASSLRE